MINSFNEEIRLTDPHRHKFDSAMAEWLYWLECDDYTGSAEWGEYVQLFGKRILFEDNRGFVTCDKYPNEAKALERFETIDRAYDDYLYEECF